MFQISAFMAWCYNWCLARAERMPRWQGYAINAFALAGFVAVILFAPNWVIFTYWFLVVGPIEVFALAHYRVWKKRDEVQAGRLAQLMQTQSLLKGFKR
ncbi:MAG: hypothetical protein AB3N24_09015 [Leisingera sp.]